MCEIEDRRHPGELPIYRHVFGARKLCGNDTGKSLVQTSETGCSGMCWHTPKVLVADTNSIRKIQSRQFAARPALLSAAQSAQNSPAKISCR